MKRLPQELFEMVIDHLHEDKDTLKACCLVAKHWISPTRFHLFYVIDLQNTRLLDQWSETFSLSTTPANYVKTLRIPHPDLLETCEAMQVFSKLRTLIIIEMSIYAIRCSKFQQTCQCFSTSLRTLCLITYMMPESLLDIICTFSHLENLDMFVSEPRTDPHKRTVTILRPSPPFSGELVIPSLDVFDNDTFIEDLINLPNSIRFRKMSLTCGVFSKKCAQNYNILLSTCAETLEEISLSIDADGLRQASSTPSISLAHNENVRYLTLEMHIAASNTWVIPLLETLKSPSILAVAFNLRGDAGAGFDLSDPWESGWTEIDRCLARFRREKYSRLEVRVRFDEYIEDRSLYQFPEMDKECALVLLPDVSRTGL